MEDIPLCHVFREKQGLLHNGQGKKWSGMERQGPLGDTCSKKGLLQPTCAAVLPSEGLRKIRGRRMEGTWPSLEVKEGINFTPAQARLHHCTRLDGLWQATGHKSGAKGQMESA